MDAAVEDAVGESVGSKRDGYNGMFTLFDRILVDFDINGRVGGVDTAQDEGIFAIVGDRELSGDNRGIGGERAEVEARVADSDNGSVGALLRGKIGEIFDDNAHDVDFHGVVNIVGGNKEAIGDKAVERRTVAGEHEIVDGLLAGRDDVDQWGDADEWGDIGPDGRDGVGRSVVDFDEVAFGSVATNVAERNNRRVEAHDACVDRVARLESLGGTDNDTVDAQRCARRKSLVGEIDGDFLFKFSRATGRIVIDGDNGSVAWEDRFARDIGCGASAGGVDTDDRERLVAAVDETELAGSHAIGFGDSAEIVVGVEPLHVGVGDSCGSRG